jgi:prophage maintenance system killer protein
MNHAFVDGNKTKATAAALVFLLINGHRLNVEESLLEETVLEVARSKKTKEELVEFFKTYTSTI